MNEMGGGVSSSVPGVPFPEPGSARVSVGTEGSCAKCHHLSLFLFCCRLRYSKYFGGVTALSREQFFKVNGFSNNYWGWGGEDDDLRLR